MSKSWTREKIYSQSEAEFRASCNKADRAERVKSPESYKLFCDAINAAKYLTEERP